jgi:hypothetical protein
MTCYALGAALVVLPQCDLINTKKDTSEPSHANQAAQQSAGISGDVLLTIGGKPAITSVQFEKYMNDILEAQPQLQQLIAIMPDAEYELFKNMVNEEALKTWVINNKIDQKENYKKDLQMLQDFGARQLAIKYFQESHPTAKVSETEMKKYYEENKNSIPEFTLSRGGINAQGVVFDKSADAQAFLAKVRDQKIDFAKAAKESNLTVREFKQVNEHSFDVDAPIREKLGAISKFPSFDVITAKDKTWVIKAKNKDAAQYVPYEQIKPRLEQFLNQQKAGESFAKDIETLKKDLQITEHRDYFDRKKKSKDEEMSRAMEHEKASMPAPMVKGA